MIVALGFQATASAIYAPVWSVIPIALLTALAVSRWRGNAIHRSQRRSERQQWAAESSQRAQLIRQVGHELRTRLNCVLGYVEILLERQTVDDLQEEGVRIQKHGGYLIHLLSDLMDAVHSSTAPAIGEQTVFGPTSVLREAISIVQPEAESLGKSIDFGPDSGASVAIQGSVPHLRQILCNMLQATLQMPGTEIRVHMRISADEGTASFVIFNDGGKWENAARCFDFSSTAADDVDGTTNDDPGRASPVLYLRIAERLATRIGASLQWVESDVVTSLELVLPTEVTERLSAVPDTQPAIKMAGRRLLVIDDSVDNQRIIRHYLEAAGAEVDIAESGYTGILLIHSAAAKNAAYDAVLMDMQMPMLDGYEATARLRSEGCDLPIIAVTAFAMDGDRNKCLDSGCDEYVTKPIKRGELLQVVQSQLRSANHQPIVV